MSMAGGTIPCFLCKAFIYYESEDAGELTAHLTGEHNAFFGVDFLLAGCVMNEDERIAIQNVVKDRQPTKRLEAEQSVLPPTKTVINSNKNEDITIEDFGLDDDISLLTPETTLQEEQGPLDEKITIDVKSEAVSPPSVQDSAPTQIYYHHCSECDLSFKLKIQLNRHMKLHEKKEAGKENLIAAKKEKIKEDKLSELKKMFHIDQDDVSQEGLVFGQIPQTVSRNSNRPDSRQSLTRGGPKSNNSGNGNAELALPGTDPGPGNVCPLCEKEFKGSGPMKRHFEDIHQTGEYPCPGCLRIFSSRNKMSSHYSRNCKNKERRTTLG